MISNIVSSFTKSWKNLENEITLFFKEYDISVLVSFETEEGVIIISVNNIYYETKDFILFTEYDFKHVHTYNLEELIERINKYGNLRYS